MKWYKVSEYPPVVEEKYLLFRSKTGSYIAGDLIYISSVLSDFLLDNHITDIRLGMVIKSENKLYSLVEMTDWCKIIHPPEE